MMYRFLGILLVLFWVGCSPATQLPQKTAQRTEKESLAEQVLFVGRVDKSTDHVRIYWPGTAIKFSFEGTEASIDLKDEKGQNYFNVVVDGGEPFLIDLDTNRNWVTLAQKLAKGVHEIVLYKRTEWDQGFTDIFNIKTDGVILEKPKTATRTIEFFGNSISTGYANEDFSGKDKPDSTQTNNYNAYSAMTARALGADMYCTAKAGIGIMVSWFPIIMPELYDRIDPYDEKKKWNFKKMTPDVVVVNLFQNDSWIVNKPDFVQFKARFGEKKPKPVDYIRAYRDFIRKIRRVYPKTPIICTLGSMDATQKDSHWPTYIKSAVASMLDKNIHTLFFPYKETAGHPNIAEHQAMADLLVKKIKEVKGW